MYLTPNNSKLFKTLVHQFTPVRIVHTAAT